MENAKLPYPEIVVGNDMLGNMISNMFGVDYVPFRREYHDDGAPKPRIDLRYDLTEYDQFVGKRILTAYRRAMLPDRDNVARHLTVYPSIVRNLTHPELFNAKGVDVLYPYWICGRQDHNPRTDPDEEVRRSDKGLGLAFEDDAIRFKAFGANRILTFHPHFHRKFGTIEMGENSVPGKIDVVCLDIVPELAEYGVKNWDVGQDGDWLVLNPDLKPSRKDYDVALAYAQHLGLPDEHLKMGRADGDKKIIQGENVDAQGRNVMIVDDIGSTYTTVETALRHIDNPGRVYATLVHSVMPIDGLRRMKSMIRDSNCSLIAVAATHAIDSDISLIPIHSAIKAFYDGDEKYRKAV